MDAGVIQVPQFRALGLGIPLAEFVAEGKDALLGARFLLVAPRAAETGVKAEFGDRVEFFGVNVAVNQSLDRVKRWVEDNKPPFTTLYDDEGTSTRAYAAPTTSYVVVVDRTGKVVYTGTGGTQDISAVLRTVAAR
jgi:hypothetical protein